MTSGSRHSEPRCRVELDRVSQALTGRIRELAERYATPLPQLTDEVATLAARVDEHLKKMDAVMEMRPGYRQTDVGVIPEAWEVRRLDSLGAGAVPPIKAGPFGSSLTKDTYRSERLQGLRSGASHPRRPPLR